MLVAHPIFHQMDDDVHKEDYFFWPEVWMKYESLIQNIVIGTHFIFRKWLDWWFAIYHKLFFKASTNFFFQKIWLLGCVNIPIGLFLAYFQRNLEEFLCENWDWTLHKEGDFFYIFAQMCIG